MMFQGRIARQNFLMQKCLQNPAIMAALRRQFSTQVETHHSEERAHHDGHGDHHDDHGHGHDVVKADPDHKFIAPLDKKYLAFTGMKGTAPSTVEVVNLFRHHNDLPLYQYAKILAYYLYLSISLLL
jgi:hypothetical protein